MPPLVQRRLRAPADDGSALFDPPLSQAPALIERNRAVASKLEKHGISARLRVTARIILLGCAEIRDGVQLEREELQRPIILAGHQPELYHPGVWLKNFALSSLATSVGATSLGLIIDNDTVRSTSIRVPSGGSPPVVEVPFDAPADAIPWEARWVSDPAKFAKFRLEVRGAFGSFLKSPAYKHGLLLDLVWPHALAAADEQREMAKRSLEKLRRGGPHPELLAQAVNLGECLATARHRVERELGLVHREAALGAVTGQPPFLEFAHRLLARHREFHAVHNAALAEYRAVNHIRSQTHPVPDLAQDGDWHEMPLWIWTMDDPRRRRVFVREAASSWELTDRQGLVIDGPAAGQDCDEVYSRLLREGIALRPRALITTMFARLVLSDLFIHGIGGAKYDELTDLIVRRFFGVEPPAFITATATFRLPIERLQISLDDVRRSAARIRDLRWHPETFARNPLVAGEPSLAEKLAALAAEKREYLAQHDLRRCPPEVFARADALNRAMHALLGPVERALRAEHAELVEQFKRAQVLGSREFSFVLFPSEILSARLLDLCKVSS